VGKATSTEKAWSRRRTRGGTHVLEKCAYPSRRDPVSKRARRFSLGREPYFSLFLSGKSLTKREAGKPLPTTFTSPGGSPNQRTMSTHLEYKRKDDMIILRGRT